MSEVRTLIKYGAIGILAYYGLRLVGGLLLYGGILLGVMWILTNLPSNNLTP